MNAQSGTLQTTAPAEVSRPDSSRRRVAIVEGGAALALRVRGEFLEMPGLRLTGSQAARLFGVALEVAHAVLDELRQRSTMASR